MEISSFKDVLDSQPYKNFGIDPVKLEFVGNTQKGLGTRLRNLVKSKKCTATANRIDGKNKSTETIVNNMQNYYCLAIFNNNNDLYGLKKAFGAILFHCTNKNNESNCHQFCPWTKDTWCEWQYDQLNPTNTYKSYISIPKWIHGIINLIFINLSPEIFLRKCFHGETQNTNECLNSILWTRCPKNIFVSKLVFEVAIHSAVLNFNDGTDGVRKMF